MNKREMKKYEMKQGDKSCFTFYKSKTLSSMRDSSMNINIYICEWRKKKY